MNADEPAPKDPAENAAEPCIRVEVVTGPMDGQNHFRFGVSFTIGRDPQCDLALELDALLDPVHARMFFDSEELMLEDLGSRSGTYVGDARLRGAAPVGPGTRFRVGCTWIEVLRPLEAAPPA